MDTLIVGYGSIGKRHARLLRPLVPKLAVVSSQQIEGMDVHNTLADAIAHAMPAYIVLCSATAKHGPQLDELAQLGFRGTVLVEKPVVAHTTDAKTEYPFTVHVGYNLRFHPVVIALQKLLAEATVLNVHAYVGQHLAQWRPDRAPHTTYSAHRDQGGGVLRDLSHELDLLAYLFGPLDLHASLAARVSDVTVDSEDSAALLLRAPGCGLITLAMNYLDHVPRRQLHILTKDDSITADLITGTIVGANAHQEIRFTADDSYIAMHRAVLAGDTASLCSLAEGLRTVALIEEALV